MIINIGVIMKRYKLIQARKNISISTRQLGGIIGVSGSMISQIENCHADPSWALAQRLERFFNIPASELLAEGEVETNIK